VDGSVRWVITDESYTIHTEGCAYLAGLRQVDRSPNTERVYAGRVALYLSYCVQSGMVWNRPGFFELGRFAQWLITEPLPPRDARSTTMRFRSKKTANAVLTTVVEFLRFGSMHGWVPHEVVAQLSEVLVTQSSATNSNAQSQTPAQVLKEARRRDSRAKRARVLEAIRSLRQSGEKITHAAVARTAGVSSWLTYADGVREHVEAAISGQVPPRPSKRDNPASLTSLRVDLELAREEIRKLRAERDQSQHNARLHLGRQLDQIGAADLTIRVHELNQSKAELEALLGAKTAETEGLARRVTELEDELTAARTSLRQMITNQSKGVASST
jgi:hypothetical protein